RARWARRQRRAQSAFFAHAPRAAKLVTPHGKLALGAPVADSCIDQAVFDGYQGEVSITGDAARGGDLTVLYDGREIERLHFDTPIGFSMVIDTKRITPDDRYRAIARDQAYYALERTMHAAIVRAVEADPRDPACVRAATMLLPGLGIKPRGPLATA